MNEIDKSFQAESIMRETESGNVRFFVKTSYLEKLSVMLQALDELLEKQDPQNVQKATWDMVIFTSAFRPEQLERIDRALKYLRRKKISVEFDNLLKGSKAETSLNDFLNERQTEKKFKARIKPHEAAEAAEVSKEYRPFMVITSHVTIPGAFEQDLDQFLKIHPGIQYMDMALDMILFSKKFTDKENKILAEALIYAREKGIKYQFVNWRDELKEDFDIRKIGKAKARKK